MKLNRSRLLITAGLALSLGLAMGTPVLADDGRHGRSHHNDYRDDHYRGGGRHHGPPGLARGHYKHRRGHKARRVYERYPVRARHYRPRYPAYRYPYRPRHDDRLHYSVTLPIGYHGSVTLWR